MKECAREIKRESNRYVTCWYMLEQQKPDLCFGQFVLSIYSPIGTASPFYVEDETTAEVLRLYSDFSLSFG